MSADAPNTTDQRQSFDDWLGSLDDVERKFALEFMYEICEMIGKEVGPALRGTIEAIGNGLSLEEFNREALRRMTMVPAVETLAKRLHFMSEKLDPTEDPDWDEMTERRRRFWRLLVEDLLDCRELIEQAWREEA